MEEITPQNLADFDMKEIYRLIHLESIPGFNLLGKERRYLAAYREAATREYATEEIRREPTIVEVQCEAPKKKRTSRKKKVVEPVEPESE